MTPPTNLPGWWKFALVLELIVCFLPNLLNLFFGVVLLPIQLRYLLSGESDISMVVSPVGGILGIIGIVRLLGSYFNSNDQHDVRVTRLLLVAGLMGFSFFVVNNVCIEPTLIGIWQVGLPIICILHILYITRRVL